jgi:hypothetical protein
MRQMYQRCKTYVEGKGYGWDLSAYRLSHEDDSAERGRPRI